MTTDHLKDPGLADLAARGYVIEDWAHWQQGHCGGYAVALMRAYPHLRLGGIDFDNDPGCDNPSHYLAHDDVYAYDSGGRYVIADGRHLLEPYARWLPDIGDPEDHGLSEHYGECGDYDDAERAAVIAHATRHGILPVVPIPRSKD